MSKREKWRMNFLKKWADIEDSDTYRKKYVKSLESYSPEEKIEWFDKMYAEMLRQLEHKESPDYHEDNDDAHYTWESCLQILGEDIFKYWNSI